MMSYQDCQPLFKYHKDELIALFVETLTGTTFEMTVSPYDTIMSIKNKIHRVEGIPVSQQHLLYNLHELEDSAALNDYSITNGSTIKLVLSMRGGPISTVRRILPLDDITWKELVDFNRDDLLDDLPPGCRMAVLVFREGDQLNMFRVLENVDGSYSPLSESWSGSSIRNLFEDEDSDETAKQRLEENTVTMEKMNDLKNRLEELAIQRKNQKFSYRNTYDEVPCASGYSPSESRKESRGKTKLVSGNKRANFVHLPPLAIDDKDLSSDLDPEERIRKTRTAEFSRVPVLPDITPSPPSIAVFDSNVDSVDLPRPKTSPDRLTGHRICEILSEAGRHRLLGAHHCSTSPLHSLPPVPSDDNNNFELDWCSSRRLSSAKPLDKPSTSASLFRSSNNSVFTKKLSATPAVNPFSFFQSSNSNSSSSGGNTVSSLFSSTTKVRKLPVRSISSKRNSTPSTIEGKSNKATSSPFQSMAKPSGHLDPFEATPKFLDIPLANANKQLPSLSSETCKNLTNCNLSSASHKESIQCNKKTPNNSSKVSENVSTCKSENSSATSGSNNSNVVKMIKKNKKEPRSRCGKCNKRLTLTNTYTCRCGHIFCANHRYSEAHECTYDYKSEGRKILEKNNPLISAPKLPKI